MIKYNWKALFIAGGGCEGAINLFKQISTEKYYSIDKLKKYFKMHKKCVTYGYILNNTEFIGILTQVPLMDACVYLKAASLRNYANYLNNRDDRLPTYMYDGDIVKLKRNPLITLDENFIYFKY